MTLRSFRAMAGPGPGNAGPRRRAAGWATPLALLAGVALANHLLAKASQRRHPPLGRFIEVDGVRLHYTDQGEGHPVVLLHGNGGMVQDMASTGLPDRLARHNRVLVFDRPGFGHSTRPRGTLWTAGRQASLLLQALPLLGVRQPILVGHSWATLVACAMALKDRQAPGGLVLLSGYHTPDWRWDVVFTSLAAVPVLGGLMRHTVLPLLTRLTANVVLRKIFSPDPVPPRFRAEFPVALAARPSQLRAMAEDTAFMTFSAAALRKREHELTLPVVILGGERDSVLDTDRHSRRLHQRLPHSRLRIVPGAGHMVHHTAPGEVEAAVRLALAGQALRYIDQEEQ